MRSGSPAVRTPAGVAGRDRATRPANSAKVIGSTRSPTRPLPVRPSPVGTNGSVPVRPRASASAWLTPPTAMSAFVCATTRPHPPVISRWTRRPLGVPAQTVEVPRRNTGWWVTSTSAASASASSTTVSTGSIARRTVRTSAAGSPHTGPTASQSSAEANGYRPSSTRIRSAKVGTVGRLSAAAQGLQALSP